MIAVTFWALALMGIEGRLAIGVEGSGVGGDGWGVLLGAMKGMRGRRKRLYDYECDVA